MVAMSAQEIVRDTLAHAQKEGGQLRTWYVGITSDVETRVYGDHNVPRTNHWLIISPAISSIAARAAELELISRGMDGGTGGGDNTATWVYAYKKTAITDP